MAGSRDPRQELAEGEDPFTTSLEQAKSWVRIYGELVDLETKVIHSVRDRMATMSPEARRITEKTNLPDMEADAERFRSRLAFWNERLGQMVRAH